MFKPAPRTVARPRYAALAGILFLGVLVGQLSCTRSSWAAPVTGPAVGPACASVFDTFDPATWNLPAPVAAVTSSMVASYFGTLTRIARVPWRIVEPHRLVAELRRWGPTAEQTGEQTAEHTAEQTIERMAALTEWMRLLASRAAGADPVLAELMSFAWIGARDDLRLAFALPSTSAGVGGRRLAISLYVNVVHGHSPQSDFILVTPPAAGDDACRWIGSFVAQLRRAYNQRVWRDWLDANLAQLKRTGRGDDVFELHWRHRSQDQRRALYHLWSETLVLAAASETLRVFTDYRAPEEDLSEHVFRSGGELTTAVSALVRELRMKPRDLLSVVQEWSRIMATTAAPKD